MRPPKLHVPGGNKKCTTFQKQINQKVCVIFACELYRIEEKVKEICLQYNIYLQVAYNGHQKSIWKMLHFLVKHLSARFFIIMDDCWHTSMAMLFAPCAMDYFHSHAFWEPCRHAIDTKCLGKKLFGGQIDWLLGPKFSTHILAR